MQNLTQRALNNAGKAALVERLNQPSDLPKIIQADTQKWSHFYALLPTTLSADQITQFEIGGLVDTTATLAWLTQKAKALGNNTSFLLEDSWAKRSDPAVAEKQRFAYTFGNSIVYAISTADLTLDLTNHLFKMLSSFEYVGCVVNAILPEPTTGLTPLPTGFLADCRMIFVGAYDREGIIVGEPT